MTLEDVRAFYGTGDEVVVAEVPAGTSQLLARNARGSIVKAEVGRSARWGGLQAGTYAIEALGPDGVALAEQLTTIGAHQGERPVHGFATSFLPESVPGVAEWLRALRCTVVQIYDWMQSYSAPLGPPGGWKDPSGREVSFQALRRLAEDLRAIGAVPHAYAPIYAVDRPFAAERPELLMYRGDGEPERLFDNIVLANPADARWQRHFAESYGEAADAIGFDGFHVDTYGFPRAGVDEHGRDIDMRAAYEGFMVSLRARRPAHQLSLNQVNGVPSAMRLPEGPAIRYCEIWPPNDRWRHFEGLLDRSSGRAGHLRGSGTRGTIACYPPVWGGENREDSLRTVLLTEAVATCLGASLLVYGDKRAVLCDPYYPKHECLSADEVEKVLAWHRFSLRYRDLFLDGEDTSWYDMCDDNGALGVSWGGGPVSPEPVGGSVFARVARTDDYVAVSVLDLSGSDNGSWSEPTRQGSCRSVRVNVLLRAPERWRADVAVLGRSGGRFTPEQFSVVEHREGLAAQLELPIEAGWSVLRLVRAAPAG